MTDELTMLVDFFGDDGALTVYCSSSINVGVGDLGGIDYRREYRRPRARFDL